MKKEEEINKDKVNEPSMVYSKKSVRFFDTYEEMNNSDAKEMSAISGLQHLANVTILIKNIFAEELKKPMDKKVHFK